MNDDISTDPSSPHGPGAELDRLKARAVEMGNWSIGMVHDGWEAFRTGDLERAQAVLDRDSELDRLDQEVEHEVVGFLVLRQPAAGDFRTAAALLKITTHIDRIGRLGFDMARMTGPRNGGGSSRLEEILIQMDQAVEAMVRGSLDALQRGDATLARELLRRDDQVDRMYREGTGLVVQELGSHPDSARRLSWQILVVRHFERIADNACKICERTIYAVTGQRRAEYLPRHPYRPYALERQDGP